MTLGAASSELPEQEQRLRGEAGRRSPSKATRVDAATVRSYFHPSPDGRFDEAARDAALKALIATDLFDTVSIERNGEKLVVHLHEAPVLDKVTFEGNKRVKDSDLTPAIESKARGSLQRAAVQADVNHIIEAYKHVGRDDVSVKPVIIDRGSDRVDLVFEVTEGAKTRSSRSTSPATRVRQAAARRRHQDLRQQHAELSDWRRRLRSRHGQRRSRAVADYYRSKGYADVSVPSVNAEYDPATKGFTLTYAIEEGPIYRFGDIAIDCHVDGVDPDKLRRLVSLQSGALFDGARLDKSNDKLSAELAKLGYPFARVQTHTLRDAVGRRVDISFAIEQGQRAYVERIDIHGNTRTRGYVIRREFDIAEGDAFNKGLIDRAERRLKNLDYFKTVKITTKPGSASDRVILDVELQEKEPAISTSPAAIRPPTAGLPNSNSATAISPAPASRSTPPSTTANTPAASMSRRPIPASSVTAPRAASIFRPRRPTPAPINPTARRITARPCWSARRSPNSSACSSAIRSRGRTSRWIRLRSQPRPRSWCRRRPAGPQWVSAVGDTATYRHVDNPKAPTSGFNSQLRQDLAGLGGDVRFLRTTEDFHYYHALNDDVVALARAQGGYITGWGGSQVPLIDNFFGGPSMVRGFAPNGFGPRDLTPGTTMDNVGGSMYWATTAELQSNIPGLPSEYGLKAVAFVDSGSVFRYSGPTTFPGSSQSLQLANANVLRSSVGVGMTWASPFGPLNVSYAVPITKASYDVTQPLGFTASPF